MRGTVPGAEHYREIAGRLREAAGFCQFADARKEILHLARISHTGFELGKRSCGSARNGGVRAGAHPGRVVADAMRAGGLE